jgi:hypothetical protein
VLMNEQMDVCFGRKFMLKEPFHILQIEVNLLFCLLIQNRCTEKMNITGYC